MDRPRFSSVSRLPINRFCGDQIEPLRRTRVQFHFHHSSGVQRSQTPGYAVVARERLKRTIVARPQGVFGHVPLPVTLLDTGNELDEIYAFRDCYVRGSLYQRPVPPVEETDPSLPPMSSAAARKTLGLKRLIEQRGLRGSARYPPRRAGRASQRTDFQPARRQRELRHQLRNFGTNSKPTFRMAPISASIRCWHGPNSISGAISSKKPYPSYRLILPKAANATARSVKKTSRFRSLRPRARSRKSSLNWNRRASRSAPAAAWSTNARMHSKLCVPPAICEPRTSSHGTVEPSCNAAQNRVCGSCRPWQVNADRLPRVRDRHSSLGPTWRQCRALDPKGLYRRARNGEITNFTGVSSPYEPPLAAELTIGDRQNGHRVLSR